MGTWFATPSSLIDPGGGVTLTKTPCSKFFALAAAGDYLALSPGEYKRDTIKPSKRAAGDIPVWIAAPDGGVWFLADPAVGSSDTLLLTSGVRDAIFDNLSLQIDDRAGIKTEGQGTRRISFRNCRLVGSGSGPLDPNWKNDCKWGIHRYLDAGFSMYRCIIENVYLEHADYVHNPQGNHAFDGTVVRHCGRTRLQVVSRKKEVATPMPVGRGDFTISNETVEDVGINDGGYAYTFGGGMPDSTVTLTNCSVRLGCDKLLASPFNKWISGCFLMQSSPESKPGAGDDAHPGGTLALNLIAPKFEVGEFWPGTQQRRTGSVIGAVGVCSIDWSGGWAIQHPGAFKTALDIKKSCQSFKWTGAPAKWGGEMIYKGKSYATWDDFAQSADGMATRR